MMSMKFSIKVLTNGLFYGVRYFDKPNKAFIDTLGNYLRIIEEGNISVSVASRLQSYYDFHNNALQDEVAIEDANKSFRDYTNSFKRRNIFYSVVIGTMMCLLIYQLVTGFQFMPSILVMGDILCVLFAFVYTLYCLRSVRFVHLVQNHTTLRESDFFLVRKEVLGIWCGNISISWGYLEC